MSAQAAAAARPGERFVVGIADMKVSNDLSATIVTHALGSCLGIAVYDPVVRVAGLLHIMLPDASNSPERAAQNPLTFVDTGVPRLFRAAYALGAEKARMELYVVGGATMQHLTASEAEDVFQIGRRNILALRKLLWRNNVLIRRQLVGGSQSRTMQIAVADGAVRVVSNGKEVPPEGGESWR
jgi:chemotaxis protein CheD